MGFCRSGEKVANSLKLLDAVLDMRPEKPGERQCRLFCRGGQCRVGVPHLALAQGLPDGVRQPCHHDQLALLQLWVGGDDPRPDAGAVVSLGEQLGDVKPSVSIEETLTPELVPGSGGIPLSSTCPKLDCGAQAVKLTRRGSWLGSPPPQRARHLLDRKQARHDARDGA